MARAGRAAASAVAPRLALPLLGNRLRGRRVANLGLVTATRPDNLRHGNIHVQGVIA
jgi:hypothetical protein